MREASGRKGFVTGIYNITTNFYYFNDGSPDAKLGYNN